MNDNYFLPDTISVAISYSRGSHDAYREAIINIIKSFERKRSYNVSVYIDRNNLTGDNFVEAIDEHFRRADIIICLVTNSFLNNEYILIYERPIIKEFSRRNDKKIIPIIVSRTNNYINSWLGVCTRTTLPTEEAPKRPYSSYPNRKYADSEIEIGLDEMFKEFHKTVVLSRSNKPRIRSKTKAKPLIFIILFLLVFLFIRSWILTQRTSKEEVVNPEPHSNPDLETDQVSIAPVKPDIHQKKSESEDSNPPNVPPSFDKKLFILSTCNSKSSMETVFPRELFSYPYFGKELYGQYESCQGINKEGYKPCKKNRRWYIVNERKDQHLILKLEDETHEDIFAIRPLLNNIAEVYLHDGESMYLSFCISLEDGEQVE